MRALLLEQCGSGTGHRTQLLKRKSPSLLDFPCYSTTVFLWNCLFPPPSLTKAVMWKKNVFFKLGNHQVWGCMKLQLLKQRPYENTPISIKNPTLWTHAACRNLCTVPTELLLFPWDKASSRFRKTSRTWFSSEHTDWEGAQLQFWGSENATYFKNRFKNRMVNLNCVTSSSDVL